MCDTTVSSVRQSRWSYVKVSMDFSQVFEEFFVDCMVNTINKGAVVRTVVM